MPQLEYTITMEHEKFIFVADHFHSDAPNYFTSYFFGEFAEQGLQEMDLYRNADLFRAIRHHLMGYDIGLLADEWYPKEWTRQTALKNLLVDAQFYGLERLISLVEEALKSASKPRRYKLFVSEPLSMSFHDLCLTDLPSKFSDDAVNYIVREVSEHAVSVHLERARSSSNKVRACFIQPSTQIRGDGKEVYVWRELERDDISLCTLWAIYEYDV